MAEIYQFLSRVDQSFSAAVASLMQPEESLVELKPAFWITWYPNQHSRGTDWHPVLAHCWIAVTTLCVRYGQFQFSEAPMSLKERTNWGFSVPAVCSKPVELHPVIAQHGFLPLSAVTGVSHAFLQHGLPFSHDETGNIWGWNLVLKQLTDQQTPKDLWLIRSKTNASGSLVMSTLTVVLGDQHLQFESFHSLEGIEYALAGGVAGVERSDGVGRALENSESLSAELDRLAGLFRDGLLSADEFELAKRRILAR